jgi:hypothetical protein
MVYFVLFDEGWLFGELDCGAKSKSRSPSGMTSKRGNGKLQLQLATATVIADLVPWI